MNGHAAKIVDMNASPVTVVATIKAKPGMESSLRAALLNLVAPSRKDDGCINYDLHQDPADPAKFMFHENWTSKAALDAHLAQPHLQTLLVRADELFAEPPVIALWSRIA